MKLRISKVLSVLCLLLALVIGACLPGFAAAKKPELITGSGVLWVGAGKCPVVASDLPANAGSFTVKTSCKSVLKVGRQVGFGPYGWWMEPLKAGKAKITLKYKTGSKTKSIYATFQVKDFPDPFETIKVNGKKISLKKSQSNLFIEDYKKNAITINWKLKSGWKVTGRDGDRIKGEEWKACSWKKNKSLSLKGYDAADLVINLKNSKTGAVCSFEIVITR